MRDIKQHRVELIEITITRTKRRLGIIMAIMVGMHPVIINQTPVRVNKCLGLDLKILQQPTPIKALQMI